MLCVTCIDFQSNIIFLRKRFLNKSFNSSPKHPENTNDSEITLLIFPIKIIIEFAGQKHCVFSSFPMIIASYYPVFRLPDLLFLFSIQAA